ncbi:hypothetical protein POM88_047058 [Heracleum sosnowskyi]|uniref:Uncharacterized protein n=1 Tax=Heracleum sosnowskyi TaxID=360622 RepID=A0AAD8M7J1_9APIA|nr:hypothetical protein POM88_047058 [Heracleum sosnowskyi]
MGKNGLSEEVFAYQIMLEYNPSVQSAENGEMQIGDDGEEDSNDGNKEEDAAVEIIQRDNFEVEHNLQMTQEEYDNNDSIEIEEYDKDYDNRDVEDDSDEEDIDNGTAEEDNVEEVEESSGTTGYSSLDSNTEAIWPGELVLEFSEKVNDMQANNLNFKEIVEKDSYVKFNNHKLEEDEGNSFVIYNKPHKHYLPLIASFLRKPLLV